jgi:hypothetical protein
MALQYENLRFRDELQLLLQKNKWLTQKEKQHGLLTLLDKQGTEEAYFVKFYAEPIVQRKDFVHRYNDTYATNASSDYHLALCTDVTFWTVRGNVVKEQKDLKETEWNDELQAILVIQPYFENSLASVLHELRTLEKNVELTNPIVNTSSPPDAPTHSFGYFPWKCETAKHLLHTQ